MALLEDQIEEAQAAFIAAHDAKDVEGAQVLADHIRDLQAQKAEVDQVMTESSQEGTNLRNPITAAGVGALAGATVNPIRGAVGNIAAPPKVSAPAPSALSGQFGQGGENWTKSLTGVDVPNAQMNKGSLDTAQRMAATVAPGGELAGGKITPGGIMLGPEVGAKPAAPTPVIPRTAAQAKQTGKSLIQGFAGEPHPTTPFSIVKGATRGAITGGALADIPQQLKQGNYGTAASDLGVATGNIVHGLSKTPKGKAIGTLLGLGSGVLRGKQGIDEVMNVPEQKAEGGLMHLAGGGQPEFGEARAYEPSYSERIRDFAANHIGRAHANRLFAGPNARVEDNFNPVAMALQTPGVIADSAAGFVKAGQEGNYLEGMGHYLTGALNVAPFTKPVSKFVKKIMPKMAGGGDVIKAGANLAKKAFNYDKYKLSQVYPDVIPPVLATDAKTGKEFLQKQLSPEAIEVQKARKAAQKQIDAGNYNPFFDVNQRYYADPSHYPTAGYTQTDIVPKKADTIAKYTELANNPESLARLRGAFEKAKDRPAAKDWYAMGQLEDAFIKELGPEEGRKQFKARFADAMAATTGGADPNSNLMMAAFTNYQKGLGKEIPTKAADLPFPIGGRFVSGNMEQAKKLAEMGEIPVTNPKRHNFSANFLGHRDVSTLDEQMSQLWDPKMMSPPPNAYGIYQQALAKEAERAGVNPVNFQDIAWAGAKDYPGKPMMQEINEMLARTHAITGEPQEEILKGFIRGNKPMYGIGAVGGLGTLDVPEEQKFAPGGKVGAAKKLLSEAQAAYKAKFTPGFYHGSPSNNIKAFDPYHSPTLDESYAKQANATFLTKNPSFANSFLPGNDYTPYRTGATVYPVSANLGKHFDYETPEGHKLVNRYLETKWQIPDDASKLAEWSKNRSSHAADLKKGIWSAVEDQGFQDFLKANNYDSFAVQEAGRKNVGIFEPQNIRGKFAKYNPEDAADPDFMKAAGGLIHLAPGGKVPEAVVKAYKLFRTKGGNTNELYPLFVNANKPVPMGEWVPAEVGPVAASGKVKSKLGELAYRPGWHAGDLPIATHIGGKSNPTLKAPDFRRADEVWAEVEMPNDVDWQSIANQRAALNKAGQVIPRTAHITDEVPFGGHYRYKTSPNMQGNWLIGGDMKVNRVLTDEEVQAINEAAGAADLPRFTPLK